MPLKPRSIRVYAHTVEITDRNGKRFHNKDYADRLLALVAACDDFDTTRYTEPVYALGSIYDRAVTEYTCGGFPLQGEPEPEPGFTSRADFLSYLYDY